jgi:NAD+ diphosphatase
MVTNRKVPHPLAGRYLDRRAEEREVADWFERAVADSSTRFLIAHRTTQLVAADAGFGALLLPPDRVHRNALTPESAVLLGWYRGERCVLLQVDDPAPFAGLGRFEELRPLMQALDQDEVGLLAYARAMSYWRERHRYCGSCGAPTQPQKAGHSLCCSREDCGTEIFPRLDPAIIVLVTDADLTKRNRRSDP